MDMGFKKEISSTQVPNPENFDYYFFVCGLIEINGFVLFVMLDVLYVDFKLNES
jgi:hypothetical protein